MVRWLVEPLPRLLEHAEALGYAGLNVTHPFKQQVIQYLDEVRDEASVLGAVNTIVFKDGKRIGHNTDWWGFRESFRRGLPLASVWVHQEIQGRLERQRLVDSTWQTTANNRRARYYALTAAGRRRLALEVDYWQRHSRAINLILDVTSV